MMADMACAPRVTSKDARTKLRAGPLPEETAPARVQNRATAGREQAAMTQMGKFEIAALDAAFNAS